MPNSNNGGEESFLESCPLLVSISVDYETALQTTAVCDCVCREEFDASSNSIEVRLHLAPHYRAEMGALRPVGDPKDAVITITFDRRKTVGDLRLAVYQVTSSNGDTY